MQYVTIWSKPLYSNTWCIERTHSKEYCKCLIGVNEVGDFVEIKGRIYGVFEENTNPNKLQNDENKRH